MIKLLGLTLLFIASVSIQQTECLATMSVDLGSEWMKIAVVSPGVPMDIVLNKESKRKTPTAVSFRDGDREFGESATTVGIRFPESSFRHIIDLLGKKMDNPIVKLFQKRFPYFNMQADEHRETVVFKLNEETKFAPEELIAMLLSKAKELAEEFSGQPIKDVVVTVPSYFNQAERRAMVRAVGLSGLKLLQLISDNTAAALNYGIFRRKDFNNTIQRIMLYDMGSSKTTATIVGYQTVKMKEKTYTEVNPQLSVLGIGYDRTLGGLEMTLRLRDHLAKAFNAKKKTKTDIFTSPRALAKLLKESERVKLVLSANNDHTAQVEGLLDDEDFKHPVSRTELEELFTDLFERVPGPVEEALKSASITLDDIDQVILVGAATRMPKVQEILTKVVNKELGKNLNTDEAIALGAVYQAAHLSQGFKVKRFGIKDAVLFPIQVDFERELDKNEGTGSKQLTRTLFNYLNPYPQKKVMTFSRHTRDFNFYVNYGDLSFMTKEEKEMFGSSKISQVSLVGVEESFNKHPNDESKGVKAHFKMDESGILLLDQVESVFERADNSTDEESTLSKLGSTLSKFFGGQGDEAKAENATEPEGEEAAPATEKAKPENVTNNATDTKEEEKKEEAAAKNETKPEKGKMLVVKENVQSVFTVLDVLDLSTEAAKASTDRIKMYNERERAKVAREEALNSLETFIIDSQDKLYQDEYEKASTDEQRLKIQEFISETSNWLEDLGIDTEAKVYKSKLDELKSKTKDLFERVKEHRDRPEARDALHGMLNMSSVFHQGISNRTAEEQYFTEVEINTLGKLIDDTQKWLDDKEKDQDALALHEKPVLTIRSIAEKLAALDREVKYLINKVKVMKPKPKTKTEEDKKNDTKDKDKTAEEEGEQPEVQEGSDTTEQPDDTVEPPPDVDSQDSSKEPKISDKDIPKPTSKTNDEPHSEL